MSSFFCGKIFWILKGKKPVISQWRLLKDRLHFSMQIIPIWSFAFLNANFLQIFSIRICVMFRDLVQKKNFWLIIYRYFSQNVKSLWKKDEKSYFFDFFCGVEYT